MEYIKNYQTLATSSKRKVVLDLIEAAFDSIQPQNVIHKNVSRNKDQLKIKEHTTNLDNFQRVFLLGFGKGSAQISSILESLLASFLYEGYVIDVTPKTFAKCQFTLGTHPLPSQANIDFTENVIEKFEHLTENDLVIIVTCGGGSVMLEKPYTLSLAQMIEVNKALLHSAADIHQINSVRKHLDIVKGGGLAKIIYPATVINLIFSDVPGNDLASIASGPTVKDPTSRQDAQSVLEKYNLKDQLGLKDSDFVESPKDDKYFAKIENLLILSNLTALEAMQQKAKQLGYQAQVYSDRFKDNANIAGKKLLELTPPSTILLVGGETSLKVEGSGQGGRNQQLVLASLPQLKEGTIIASFDSDGWDNTEAAGAIADQTTLKKAKDKDLDPQKFQQENNSLAFFKSVGDAILTGRLPSNVSDLMIVAKI
ncbi:DUF4147 domain-containing protein [Candidatus Curtissbacteria bacterium]|nr:DUF4147 domain-containing protein [Candidatus Curtissbacteria bacterium]